MLGGWYTVVKQSVFFFDDELTLNGGKELFGCSANVSLVPGVVI